MFRTTVWMGIVVLSLAAAARAQDAAEPPATPAPATQPTSEEARKILAYAVGQEVGQSIKNAPIEISFDLFIQGCRDFLEGKDPKYDPATIVSAQQKIQQDLMAEELAKQQAEFAKNAAAGSEYLATNGKKTGVKTLASGIQIETLTAGTGTAPKPTDIVKVHYKGTLLDGTVFDSSRNSEGAGEPISFPLNQVIPGWTEGLQQMKVGEKARLVIPQEHAYGIAGSPPVIPSGATLIFEIELLGATPAPPSDAMP